MRWTRNDSEAFNVINKAGQQLRDAWEKRQAGEAYNAAMRGLSTPEQVAFQDKAVEAAGVNPNVEYDSYDFQNADTMRAAGLNSNGFAAIDPIRQEAATTAANKLVLQAQSAAPTAQQKRMAGLQAMEQFYAGRGDSEQALKYGTMYDQAEAAGLAREDARLGITAKKREARIADAVDANFKNRQSAMAELGKLQELAIKNPNDPTVFQALSDWYKRVPNGEDFNFDATNGMVSLTKNGYGQTAPASPEILGKLFEGAAQRVGQHFDREYSNIGAAQHSEMRKEGRADRELEGKLGKWIAENAKDAATGRYYDAKAAVVPAESKSEIEYRTAMGNAATSNASTNRMTAEMGRIGAPVKELDANGNSVLVGTMLDPKKGLTAYRVDTGLKPQVNQPGGFAAIHPELQKDYMAQKVDILNRQSKAKTAEAKAEFELQLRNLDTAYGVRGGGTIPPAPPLIKNNDAVWMPDSAPATPVATKRSASIASDPEVGVTFSDMANAGLRLRDSIRQGTTDFQNRQLAGQGLRKNPVTGAIEHYQPFNF